MEILPKNACWSLLSSFLVTVVLLRAKTYHKAVCSLYTSQSSDPVAKYQLAKFGHAQKEKLGLKVTQQSWLLLFAFSPPLFFHFSCLIFFPFAAHLVGFILVGKVFRIVGLGERKSRWVVKQDFHGNFRSTLHGFLPFSPLSLTKLCSFLYGLKSLRSAHISGQSCPWPLKLMMSQAVEGTWIHKGGYRWLRDEWVIREQRCFTNS